MDGESSCESDISDGWTILDLNSSNPDLRDTNKNGPYNKIQNIRPSPETFELMSLSSSTNDKPPPHIKGGEREEEISNKPQPPTNKDSLEGKVGEEEGGGGVVGEGEEVVDEGGDVERDDRYSESDSVEIVDVPFHLDYKYKELDFDTDGISVISEEECGGRASEDNQTSHQKQIWLADLEKYFHNFERCCDSFDESCDEATEEPPACNEMVEHRCPYPLTPTRQRVYQHYRNNVANSALNLAVGVAIAGVACIALGHFLGVHNTDQSVGNVFETLKKLQMENIIIHSRLTQLSRALFKLEARKYEKGTVEKEAGPEKVTFELKSLGRLIELRKELSEVDVRKMITIGGNLDAFIDTLKRLNEELKEFKAFDAKEVEHFEESIEKSAEGFRVFDDTDNSERKHLEFDAKLRKLYCEKVDCDEEMKLLDEALRRYERKGRKGVEKKKDESKRKMGTFKTVDTLEEFKAKAREWQMKEKLNKKDKGYARKVNKDFLKWGDESDEWKMKLKQKEVKKEKDGKKADTKQGKNYKEKRNKNGDKKKGEKFDFKGNFKGKEGGKLKGKFRKCQGSKCNNSSSWMTKWAKGREQCRKNSDSKDWQFERAKGRAILRGGDFWLFERASARAQARDDAKWYFRRNEARHFHRKGFSPESFSWI